ncbi:MAG: response regulator [Deinococcales bacterium]|nr:response regulator [Chitinophagaceae bacterium]
MKKRSVLIIDDETDLCILLYSYLKRKNFDVQFTHNLKDGLAIINSAQPDVLFLDNNLPDGFGWEIAPELSKTFPKIKIYLISAFHPNPPKFDDYNNVNIIEKPISTNTLDNYLN